MKSGLSTLFLRYRGLIIVLILAGAVILIDPLRYLAPRPVPASREFTEQDLEPIRSELGRSQPALDAVYGIDARHSLVLLGGDNRIHEHLAFLADLIRNAPGTRFADFGVEFLLSADQEAIDRLTGATEWDEAAAQALLFSFNVQSGYAENLAVLKAAWEANRGRAAGSRAIRVHGLNVAQDYSVISSQEDLEDPEVMRRIHAAGVPDQAMAAALRRIVAALPKGAGMVAMVGTSSAFTRWPDQQYQEACRQRGLGEQRRLGESLAQEPGLEPWSVIMAGPLAHSGAGNGLAWFADGALDQALAGMAEPSYPFSVLLGSSGLGAVECRLNMFGRSTAEGVVSPRLADLADQLVVVAPGHTLTAFAPLAGFITEANLERARARMAQASNPAKLSAEQINNSMGHASRDYQTRLGQFRPWLPPGKG